MNKESIIKKIEIEIAGVNVKVTPKEARALLDALSELLNVQPKVKIIEIEKLRDRWLPYQPYWYEGTRTINSPNSDKWSISYSSNENMASVKI